MILDDDILREVVIHMTPLIQIYGLYVVFHGHLTPGGGFSGGVVLALSMVLFSLVFGRRATMLMLVNPDRPAPGSARWRHTLAGFGLLMDMNARVPLGLVAGALVIAVKMVSFMAPGMLKVPLGTPGSLFSSGLILIVSSVVGLVVASTILTLFLILVGETPHGSKPVR